MLFVCGAWLFASAAMASHPICRIPVDFVDGLIWVDVHTPGRPQPFRFLLDSGASHSVLNHKTAQDLELDLGDTVPVKGVGIQTSGFGPVPWRAQLGGIDLPERFLVLDLNALSTACQQPVDGLVGADFFRDRIVEIDYVARELRLLREPPTNDEARALRMSMGPRGISILGSINGGKEQRLRVDTGCATALHWVSPRTLSRTCPGPAPTGLSKLSIPQTLAGIQLGPHHLDTVSTGIHRKPIFPGESGLLGNGLLAMFGVVTFDARSHLLHLGETPSLR